MKYDEWKNRVSCHLCMLAYRDTKLKSRQAEGSKYVLKIFHLFISSPERKAHRGAYSIPMLGRPSPLSSSPLSSSSTIFKRLLL